MNLKIVTFNPDVDPEITVPYEVDQYILFRGDNMFSPVMFEALQQKAKYQELVKIDAVTVTDRVPDDVLNSDEPPAKIKK